MKWIKYQVVNGTKEDGNPLLVIKKVEYNETNLRIAQSEAYAGAYKIEKDDEEPFVMPLPLDHGGTSAITRPDASQNINFIGVEPIKKVDEDTVQKWADLGTGFTFYNDEILIGLPVRGFVESKCYKEPISGNIFISQTLRPATNGASYHRAGSSDEGWYTGWMEIIDENSSKLPFIQTGYYDDITVPGNTLVEKEVTFPVKFSTTPRVLLQMYSSSDSHHIGSITVALSKAPSKTGFKMRMFNNSSTQRAPSVYWVAIGK
jgi:hypothetical protein